MNFIIKWCNRRPFGLSVNAETKQRYICYKGQIYAPIKHEKITIKEKMNRMLPYSLLVISIVTVLLRFADPAISEVSGFVLDHKQASLIVLIALVPLTVFEWHIIDWIGLRLFDRLRPAPIPDLNWRVERRILVRTYIFIVFIYAFLFSALSVYYIFNQTLLYFLSVLSLLLVGVVSDPCHFIAAYHFQTKQIKKQEAQLSTNNEK